MQEMAEWKEGKEDVAQLMMDELKIAVEKWKRMPIYPDLSNAGTQEIEALLEMAFRTGALAMHQIMKRGSAFSSSKPQ